MGIMGVLKWLRKEGSRDQQRWSMSPELSRLNNEASRIKAIRAFMDRRKSENESDCLLISSPDKDFHFKTFVKKFNQSNKAKDSNCVIPGVPHIKSSELFEIGWVAGTEDHYLEYIYAEWDNTKISLKKHTHPECEKAIKADLAVLTEIRHPNIVLLIATSFIEGHGLVSIFESLNCTLYNYIHEKGERISIQEMSRCIRKLAEALGFAHMRGYIHGALSSHCVFLASGIVKLGGWELTTKKNEAKEEQDFENRLRAEIFRWQAPEIFSGQIPTEATDIYGLALLIWEMTTMHLPWSGLSKAEVEKQYIHWKGVEIDLYNFPPLLSNLLETGLEIDVTKRSLSMNRMRRFLQRLELQYETEAPIYADQLANNNNLPNIKTLNVPDYISPLKKHSASPLSSANRKTTPKPLVNAQNNICNIVRKLNSKNNLAAKESVKTQKTANPDPISDIKKNTNLFLETERLHDNAATQEDLWTIYNCNEQQKDNSEIQGSVHSIVNKGSNSTSEERISSIVDGSISSRTIESSDDNFNETRNDIKKLRETLANRRERFFYGDSFQNCVSNISTEDKNTALNSIRSKDYEPHKPASHKTSFEPKLHKSVQYETMSIKATKDKEQTFDYSGISSSIKDAVLHPQLVSANHENIFESSLWRKEKMICISKMRKSYTESNMITYSQYLKEGASQNDQGTLKPVENKTFIINDVQKPQENILDVSKQKFNKNSFDVSNPKLNENISAISEQLVESKSINESDQKFVEDNLDILNQSFIEDNTLDVSDKKLIENNNLNMSVQKFTEEITLPTFNNQYSQNDTDCENKPLEALKLALDRATEIICPGSPSVEDSNRCLPLKTLEDNCILTAEDMQTREALFENVVSKINNNYLEPEIKSIERYNVQENQYQISHNTYKIKKPFTNGFNLNEAGGDGELESPVNDLEEKENDDNLTLLLFSDKNHDKECNSCHHTTALARRRSLPAALGQLKAYNRMSVGKLPILKTGPSDNTVEDLYIDDEFGESLNVNMVLLENDNLLDEDILPDLLELSHNPIFNR